MNSAPCPLCGSASSHQMTMPIDPKTFKATPFGSIYRCAGCAFGFVHPRPTVEETAAFYQLDAYYTQGQSHVVDTGPQGLASKVRTHLAWRMDKGESLAGLLTRELKPGASVLDVGCGSGALLLELQGAGFQCTGIERDAATLARRDLRVLEGSAEVLPAGLGHFDAIVYSHVVEHLVDPAHALRLASSHLAPGGRFFVEVPNNEALVAGELGLAWEPLDPPRHLGFFTERALLELAGRAGLKAQSTYFSGYCRYFSDTYIATEQRIFDRLPPGSAPALRNSRPRSWWTLARTAFAVPRRKYDAVGLVASL